MESQIEIKRETEFYQGFIRFKLSVLNKDPSVVTDVSLDFIFEDDLLSLDRYEPHYELKNSKILLGNISGGTSKSITVYFDPLMCTKSTEISCQINYRDAHGKLHSTFMEKKSISVVCPIINTDQDINVGRLKEFIEKLPNRDSKIYEIQHGFDISKLASISRDVLEKHDVRHVRTLKTKDGKDWEIWYYGRTKVKKADIVIKVSISSEKQFLELFAATESAETLTGLLAEFGRDLKSSIESRSSGKSNVINVTIHNSVIQKSNLIDLCSMDGTCPVNILVEDSVIQHSSLISERDESKEESLRKEREKQEKLRRQQEEETRLRKAQEEADRKKKEQERQKQEELHRQREEEEKKNKQKEALRRKQREEQEQTRQTTPPPTRQTNQKLRIFGILLIIITALSFVVFFPSLPGASAKSAPEIEWQKSLGGSGYDFASSVKQTSDSGYIVAGSTDSKDGDVTGNHGGRDYWIVKLDTNGNKLWQKCLGGSSYDGAVSISQTSDGGCIVVGYSGSNDGDVTGNHGDNDYWIVKLDTSGNLEWQKSLGGSSNEEAFSVTQTSDGGFIVAGYSASNDGDVTGNHGGDNDYWIVKLDTNGNTLWQKSMGGSDGDSAYSVTQTSDGGCVIAGTTYSKDGDVVGNHGSSDYWVVKLDAEGNLKWQKSLGGSDEDFAYSVQQTSDDGYIVAGSSHSSDGDVTGNHRSRDYWIVKLDTDGNLEWQKSLGGLSGDEAFSVQQTSDDGYIVAGSSHSSFTILSMFGDVTGNHGSSDYWVVKLDTKGNLKWQKSLGGSGDDGAYSVQQTSDGGYIVAGYSASNDSDVTGNHGDNDYWIVKLRREGSGI